MGQCGLRFYNMKTTQTTPHRTHTHTLSLSLSLSLYIYIYNKDKISNTLYINNLIPQQQLPSRISLYQFLKKKKKILITLLALKPQLPHFHSNCHQTTHCCCTSSIYYYGIYLSICVQFKFLFVKVNLLAYCTIYLGQSSLYMTKLLIILLFY